jgi:hypothetical protein
METIPSGNGLPSKEDHFLRRPRALVMVWVSDCLNDKPAVCWTHGSSHSDRPHFDYLPGPVPGILDVPPFAQSALSYGIAPQPTSSDVTSRAGNVFPPPSCPDPITSDTFSYCPPTSSADLPVYPSTIPASISQFHLTPTTTMDPDPLVLKSHNDTDAQDKVARQAKAPRPTKVKKPRSESTGIASLSLSGND